MDEKKNVHDGHRERMRARFERDIEMEAFSEHEMIEFLLFYAIPRKDTNEIAHRLISSFGSLSNIFNASVFDLCAVKGMTKNAALLLKTLPPLSKAVTISRQKGKTILANAAQSFEYFKNFFEGETSERVFVACLDVSYRVLDVVNIGKGSAGNTEVDITKMLRVVAASNAANVILMHNHPGGNLIPSRSDLLTTNLAIILLYAYRASLADHIIFAPDGKYFSFYKNRITDLLVANCNRFLSFDISDLYRGNSKLVYQENSAIELDRETNNQTADAILQLFEAPNATMRSVSRILKDISPSSPTGASFSEFPFCGNIFEEVD